MALQVKIIDSDKLESDINAWLVSRDAQKYHILKMHYRVAGNYGGYRSVLIEYDDEPEA